MCSRSVGLIVRALSLQVDCRLSRRLPVGRRRLDPHLERHPHSRTSALRSALTAVDMERPSSSRMAVASLLTFRSIRIVVVGMFDGMAVPFLVYRGATITTVSMRRARHRERPFRAVALERLGEVGLVELAAAATLDLNGGGRPRGTRSACGVWCRRS